MPINATAVANLPNVQCIDKCTPFGRQLAVLIALAAQWGGLSTNPAVLQANASCFTQCIPKGMQMGVLISLAEQISGGVGGSPASCSYTPVNSEVQTYIVTQCQVSTGVCRTVSNLPVAKALDVMVSALKTAGVWTALDALYPFVGGTAASCSLNLVNPATYQIAWHGGVTFSASGVTFDGVTGYGDTAFNPTTAGGNYQLHSGTLGAFTQGQFTGPGSIGLFGSSTSSPLDNNAALSQGVALGINGTQFIPYSGPAFPYVGLFAATVTAVNTRTIYVPNGNSADNSTHISDGLPNFDFLLCRGQGGGSTSFVGGTMSLAFIGSGFSAPQIAAIQAAVTAYVNTPGVPGCP